VPGQSRAATPLYNLACDNIETPASVLGRKCYSQNYIPVMPPRHALCRNRRPTVLRSGSTPLL
jgi:hypothetical protein